MPSPENNLFVRLHKWASRQDENFVTDAFAHVLQHLLENEPEAAVGILESLTGGLLRLKVNETKLVAIQTQNVLSEGTPDIAISTVDALVFIEVKVESDVVPEQLALYRRLLRESGIGSTRLVLLTRYPPILTEGDELPDLMIRWYQVAEWLDHQSKKYTYKAVSAYLVEQFLSFLGSRYMTMGQVTYELASGIRAMQNLVYMLIEAASACGVRTQHVGSRNDVGVYLERRDYWVGIGFDEPDVLWFNTYNRPVNKDIALKLPLGEVYEWESKPGYGWGRNVNLNSEEVHFFSRSKAGQMQFLEKFIRESLELARKAELPREPEESDDNPVKDEG